VDDDSVRSARPGTTRDHGRDHVRLEGVHALKHALRFGAEVVDIASRDPGTLADLLARLAPDVTLPVAVRELDAQAWAGLTEGREPPSPVIAFARRPTVDVATVLAAPGRVVVLEDPRHRGNLGAVVRVAAAAGAAGVLVVGDADPWHPTSVRTAAGLHFALPVARTDALPVTARPCVALVVDGAPLGAGALPADALLLFGTERDGLSQALLARAQQRVAIPMRTGVSSLNLATAVAVTLWHG